MNLRLPRWVISTGPRKAASTTSPDRLLKSVREKCANGISLNREARRYHDFSYFSYLRVSIKGDFFGKTKVHLKNHCSINNLHAWKEPAGDPWIAPAASRCLCPRPLIITLADPAVLPPAAWDSREIDGSRGEPGLRR